MLHDVPCSKGGNFCFSFWYVLSLSPEACYCRFVQYPSGCWGALHLLFKHTKVFSGSAILYLSLSIVVYLSHLVV
uniref:Putative ovule protein n=1 Tax=Solanum chacoense TaxID=4108 RepID=A0A0V0HRM6_SOLCH